MKKKQELPLHHDHLEQSLKKMPMLLMLLHPRSAWVKLSATECGTRWEALEPVMLRGLLWLTVKDCIRADSSGSS